MTNQEIFDRVAVHLLTQMERSVNGRDCAYRGAGGLKCAVGCLIPDSMYIEDMEGKTVAHPLVYDMFPAKASSLLRRLQRLHDARYPGEWRTGLVSIAADLDLDNTVIGATP